MFTLVLLLVVLASMRGRFRAVWLPPGLDAYWYAYQETGDLQCWLHRQWKRRLQRHRQSCCHRRQILQPHSTPSHPHVSRRVRPPSSRRTRSILTSAIALRSKVNVWSTSKPPRNSPSINRHKFHSLWGSLKQALLQQHFQCWLARLQELLLWLFYHCH